MAKKENIMKKKLPNKLTLSRETIRDLEDESLSRAAGATGESCYISCTDPFPTRPRTACQ